MISSLLLIAPTLWIFSFGALALPTGTAAAAAITPMIGKLAENYCTDYPSWTVTDFKSSTSDSVGSGGSASFTVVNNLSGARDELTCSLQVNYRCIIAGTPSDGNLTVHVAIRAGSLTFILDEAVECPGRTT